MSSWEEVEQKLRLSSTALKECIARLEECEKYSRLAQFKMSEARRLWHDGKQV